MAAENPDDRMCRYCFGDASDGELISPCKCTGGQEFVHMACLHRWQRMVLVAQSTHPAYYKDDERQYICNVCQSKYSCKPATRGELMESFTGPEIAAMIDEGRLIASQDLFSDKLEKDLETIPMFLRETVGYSHWVRGVYLITGVEEEDGEPIKLPFESPDSLSPFLEKMGEDLQIEFRGKKYRLSSASPSLQNAGLSENDFVERTPAFRSALSLVEEPCCLALCPVAPPTCADDQVSAVNLTRKVDTPRDPQLCNTILEKVYSKYPAARKVQIEHYLGGPCDPEKIMSCVVLGGVGRGWTIVSNLEEAVALAHARGARRTPNQGDIGGGQAVRLKGLKARPELNGEVGLALQFSDESGRWMVRMANGDGLKIKPDNLEGVSEEGKEGKVLCVWGDARWSRVQLLGEIARGHWGLTGTSVSDLVAPSSERWAGTKGRLAFAPITDMTEEWLKNEARDLMEAYRDDARRVSSLSEE
eukprot:CAMPEP_0201489348 /NCGR_PEP_ID=MMETSP0151_2-20130828/22303_1 /ASSEMBLY_ACC=CAM_ASM_000257 /TAXON_ID=200890 /ORGANISM="Paramoeba atlantica, Strain 621/1 / CCAP 1560/9" /LENGTH=474 /DNA_ID=CAMNT_0047874917 /DNA_START=58 /DNA_END=1482 /DNA_ORIENTATION=-